MIRFQLPHRHRGGGVRRIAKAVQGLGPAARVEAEPPTAPPGSA